MDTKDAKADATIVTDVLQQSKSIDSPEMSISTSRDIIPSLGPLMSTTTTQGSFIPSSTNHSEEHQNSSQAPTPETFPPVSLIPPSIPASTLKDSINGSASLENENQDEPSELDVGDEDLDKAPSPFPLDPLLAGLISIFIISTALLSILLFLKFRQQSSHPEFHRLQDLPM
ncbi:platelet glycoprotein Ib alpha chain-like, partial [Clarias magur]